MASVLIGTLAYAWEYVESYNRLSGEDESFILTGNINPETSEYVVLVVQCTAFRASGFEMVITEPGNPDKQEQYVLFQVNEHGNIAQLGSFTAPLLPDPYVIFPEEQSDALIALGDFRDTFVVSLNDRTGSNQVFMFDTSGWAAAFSKIKRCGKSERS